MTLNEEYRLPYVEDLIARKVSRAEQSTLESPELDLHRREYERLGSELEGSAAASKLPEEPSCRAALNDLLVRLRMAGS